MILDLITTQGNQHILSTAFDHYLWNLDKFNKTVMAY